jgi:hypothetical protein
MVVVGAFLSSRQRRQLRSSQARCGNLVVAPEVWKPGPGLVIPCFGPNARVSFALCNAVISMSSARRMQLIYPLLLGCQPRAATCSTKYNLTIPLSSSIDCVAKASRAAKLASECESASVL